MEIINSLDNKKIKNYSKLLQKKYRDESGLFIVEGEHLVTEAYKHNYLVELIKTNDCDLKLDVDETLVSYAVIKKLSNTFTPQKVIGICKKKSDKLTGNKILILDGIQDPGNLGTIIRSSVAFNVDTIVLSKDTVDLYNDKVLRATEGMLFNVNIIREDIESIIYLLHKDNFKIYGTRVTDGKSIKDINKNDKIVLIVGNEGNGIGNNILDKCDDYIYIKMNDNCESLNVGVATSIILYELF